MSEHECEEAVASLYIYLDGEMDEAALRSVEAHLAHCSPCLEAFDFEAELRRVVSSKCAESMPADLRDKLLGMLDDADSSPA
jgi:mycothiol system anti-sigma-R factor